MIEGIARVGLGFHTPREVQERSTDDDDALTDEAARVVRSLRRHVA